jgi:hypothetical protein
VESKGICPLCCKEAELRNSHIVPSFFGAYLKETSATGYLRAAAAPNIRAQDLVKERLLCDACEGRFSVWEKEFKEKAFLDIQDDRFAGIRYGTWLLPFLVSLSSLTPEDQDGGIRALLEFTRWAVFWTTAIRKPIGQD